MKSILVLVGLVLAFGTTPTTASAQGQSALEVVERLNSEAMEAYLNMDIDRAGAMLEEALRVAQEGGVGGQPYAQTNLNLGVVLVGGLGDSDAGASYFLMAVCTVPSIQLDPLNSTPEMQQAFARARQQSQQGGCPAGAGAAPVNTSPVSPANAAAGANIPLNAMDDETPWGESAREEEMGEFRRFFFQLSFAYGLAYIQPGMKADRKPPDNLVFGQIPSTSDIEFIGPIEDPGAAYRRNLEINTALAAPNLSEEQIQMLEAQRTYFRLREDTPWVPDGDSEDSLGALTGACSGDGNNTGPFLEATDPATDPESRNIYPSDYCVRVNGAGFASTVALRTALGYFVNDWLGLGIVARLQLGSGEGSLSNLLFGPRAEFMVANQGAVGFGFSLFIGGHVGQIQVLPPDSPSDGPWIVSGMFGAHAGASLRYRFIPNFGLVLSPELDLQFPDVLFNIDIPLGVEVAF